MTTRKSLPTDLIDNQLADYKKPEDLIDEMVFSSNSSKC